MKPRGVGASSPHKNGAWRPSDSDEPHLSVFIFANLGQPVDFIHAPRDHRLKLRVPKLDVSRLSFEVGKDGFALSEIHATILRRHPHPPKHDRPGTDARTLKRPMLIPPLRNLDV